MTHTTFFASLSLHSVSYHHRFLLSSRLSCSTLSLVSVAPLPRTRCLRHHALSVSFLFSWVFSILPTVSRQRAPMLTIRHCQHSRCPSYFRTAQLPRAGPPAVFSSRSPLFTALQGHSQPYGLTATEYRSKLTKGQSPSRSPLSSFGFYFHVLLGLGSCTVLTFFVLYLAVISERR